VVSEQNDVPTEVRRVLDRKMSICKTCNVQYGGLYLGMERPR
jgi:hypothetical protein